MIADAGQDFPVEPSDADPGRRAADREHLNVSGDLPSVLDAAPMFRRTVGGYDRFQVDTYVQWAEDELATAAREREHLVEQHLRTRAELADARGLLAHSAGGGEFLRVSKRIGSMLAAATDEAECIRAEADNHRSVARAQAEVVAADAQRLLSEAKAEAVRAVGTATTEAEELVARAALIVDDAEQTRRDASAAAEVVLEEARAIERLAVEQAETVVLRAEAEALVSRDAARDEIVRMLGTAREQRRRADDEAAATRVRLDRDAAARRAALLTEVDVLEHRRAVLLAQMDVLARAAATGHGVSRRRLGERIGWRSRTLRTS
jgi:cell division septum initiation protein DivIVA